MVWLAARRNWDATRALLIGGIIAILVSHITLAILSGHDGRLAFFSIMTRAWQFAAGGMLAIAVLRGATAQARLRPVLGVLGLLAVVGIGAVLQRAHAVSGHRSGIAADHRHANAAGIRPRQRPRAAGAVLASRPAVRDRRSVLQLVSLALAADRADAHAADRTGKHLEGRRLVQRGAAACRFRLICCSNVR